MVDSNNKVEVEIPGKAGDVENSSGKTKKKWYKPSCCSLCAKITFVTFITITIIISVAVLVVSVGNAIITRTYSSGESGRVAGMIVLAVTASITIASCVYAIVAVFRKKMKPLHIAGILLLTVAVIQIVVAGTSVKMTASDEEELGRSLTESFRMARDNNPRQHRIWASTQNDLKCCGLYGPDDYRTPGSPFPLIAPDVPIFCCPGYDSERSELLQESARETCKIRREYRQMGCRYQVTELFQTAAQVTMSHLVALIILEIFIALLSIYMSRKAKKEKEENEKNTTST